MLRDYAAEAERLDKLEDRERAMRAEERAERAAQRIAELGSQVARESQRTSRALHAANDAHAARRAAVEGYQRPAYRADAYGQLHEPGSYRYRSNYWE